MEIKTLKGIEKICLGGIIIGVGLGIYGKTENNLTSSLVGASTVIAAVISCQYAINKRKNLEDENKNYKY